MPNVGGICTACRNAGRMGSGWCTTSSGTCTWIRGAASLVYSVVQRARQSYAAIRRCSRQMFSRDELVPIRECCGRGDLICEVCCSEKLISPPLLIDHTRQTDFPPLIRRPLESLPFARR